jgi:hypothetical protein
MAPTTDNSKSAGAAIEVHYPVSTVEMTAFTAVCGSRERPLRVKTSKAQNEQMFSGLPPKDGVIGRSLWIAEDFECCASG